MKTLTLEINMDNKMSRGAGSAFGGKKYLGILVSAGLLLFAGTALAAAYVPGSAGSQTQGGSSIAQPGAQVQSGALRTMPCPMMDQSAMGQSNMMYRQWPCGPMYYQSVEGFSGEGAWLALMVVITVIMVWVVLLLLICVLIHWLKDHRHHK